MLAAFLVLAFAVGGGARSDIQSLIILRPVAALACGAALLTLRWEHIRTHRALFGFAVALILIFALQLVPLPPTVWQTLPGRSVIADIDVAVGLKGNWRPLSMAPPATWNALHALLVPLAVLLLGVQLPREDRFRLLPVMVALGMISGLLGLLQVTSGRNSSLYLYEITNPGAAVGLFSNRNHQGLLLASLYPLLAVFAWAGLHTLDQARLRLALAMASGLVLVPLILVTDSRAGLALGLLGLLSVPFLYRRPTVDDVAKRQRRMRSPLIPGLLGGCGVIILGLLATLFSRAGALDRLTATGQENDLRFRVWGPIVDMAWRYFPFGSGAGTFDKVFQLNEPEALLKPTYLNHAHNDWLEVFLTDGALGSAFIAAVAIAWAAASANYWLRGDGKLREIAYARMGSIVLLLTGLASITDYPLRTPSLACLAMVAAIWLRGGGRDIATTDSGQPKNSGTASQSRLAARNGLEGK